MTTDPQTRSISCREAAEFLPWLINGSLEEGERLALVKHLAGCQSCRREFEETEQAWEIFSQHVPSLVLAEHALGLPISGLDRERIEQHLAVCPSCRQEFELARSEQVVDLQAAREGRVIPLPGRSARSVGGGVARWRLFAAAASVTAVLAVGILTLRFLERDVPARPVAEAAVPATPEATPRKSLVDGLDAGPRPGAPGLLTDGFESGTTNAWLGANGEQRPALRNAKTSGAGLGAGSVS